MKIRVFNEMPGLINSRVWIEEERDISSEDDLKQCMKKLFSAMKKRGGWNDVSFQLCSDSGFYVVVDRYDSESDSFRTMFCERWNSKDEPKMKSQKNVMAWAMDIFNLDSQAA